MAGGVAIAGAALGWPARSGAQVSSPAPDPLDIARRLAARYPAAPIMSYIPALSWSGSLRLAQITGEARWREKPRREMAPFLDGRTPAIAEPYLLTSLAGHQAFADAGVLDGNREAAALAVKAADFMLAPEGDAIPVRFARQWTDDMFMATSVLARVAATSREPKYAAAVSRLLTSYIQQLQRPDGLFVHSRLGPHAWGRGNGFALLGLLDALTYLPADAAERTLILSAFQRQVAALARSQDEEGMWHQVVDVPASYKEFTVTAMTVAALARGISRGWLDRATCAPVLDRGWRAVAARVTSEGITRDVCSGTGSEPTLEYYLNRPISSGADDRGGAMGLLAAIEVAALRP
jgi:rhamnogalacturonyl hydrolase YesR